jgi:hypothetical protein
MNGTMACSGWLAICSLVFLFSVVIAETDWESTIRKNTPADIVLTSIQEEGTKVVIRGTANSNPDLAEYTRTLSGSVGEPKLAQVTREDDKSVFVLRVEKAKR